MSATGQDRTTLDESAVERDLIKDFEIARRNSCVMDVLLKDIHSVKGQIGRLRRWVEIAKRARAKVYGA